MKWLSAAVIAASLVSAALPAAASDKSDVVAAIRQTTAYANSGNDAGFGGMLAPESFVIDEFAPFHWNGFGGWGAAYARYNTQNAVTAPHTTILGFKAVNVDGDRAYAVVRVRYTYKEGGKPRVEPGIQVFTLEKIDGHWKNSGFAWMSKDGVDAGTEATAVLDAIHKENDDFAAGKIDLAALPWAGIIDEFAPYRWQGVGAASHWASAFGASGQALVSLKLGAPVHLSVNGDDAYVVLPADIVLKDKKKTVHEKGLFAYAMVKADGAWRTHGWAWAIP